MEGICLFILNFLINIFLVRSNLQNVLNQCCFAFKPIVSYHAAKRRLTKLISEKYSCQWHVIKVRKKMYVFFSEAYSEKGNPSAPIMQESNIRPSDY